MIWMISHKHSGIARCIVVVDLQWLKPFIGVSLPTYPLNYTLGPEVTEAVGYHIKAKLFEKLIDVRVLLVVFPKTSILRLKLVVVK
jgi:hypothetical protein